MCKLLQKELRLAAHPTLYIFMCMGALLLIPAYPYGVVFFFSMMGVFQSTMYARETRDIYYSALLPIRKRDVVKSKLLVTVFAQLGQLLLSLPFAFLRTLYLPEGNPVGIEANVAYYGFGLMIFGVFNFVFYTQFFKTAYKAGAALLTALVPTVLMILAMEAAVHFPGLGWLDGLDKASLLRQLPVLGVGALVYVGGTVLVYRIGAARFQRVDL